MPIGSGIRVVLIPEENEKDLVEIPANIKQHLDIRPVRWIDEVLLFPREGLETAWRDGRPLALGRLLRGFLSGLRSRRFDLVVDFHAILKSGALAAASGAPVRAGLARTHAREGAWLFSNRRVRLPNTPQSRFDRNDALVASLGIEEAQAARLEERNQRREGVVGQVLVVDGVKEKLVHDIYEIGNLEHEDSLIGEQMAD